MQNRAGQRIRGMVKSIPYEGIVRASRTIDNEMWHLVDLLDPIGEIAEYQVHTIVVTESEVFTLVEDLNEGVMQ
jgi:hypothetical protein